MHRVSSNNGSGRQVVAGYNTLSHQISATSPSNHLASPPILSVRDVPKQIHCSNTESYLLFACSSPFLRQTRALTTCCSSFLYLFPSGGGISHFPKLSSPYEYLKLLQLSLNTFKFAILRSILFVKDYLNIYFS